MTAESMTEDDVKLDMGSLLRAVLSRWLRIIAVTLILVAIAYAILMFVPKVYESQSSILVEPRQNAFTDSTGQASSSTVTAEAAVSSQIELIKSRDTLLGVIDQLDLRSKPEFNGSQGGFSPIGVVMQLIGRGADIDIGPWLDQNGGR